MKKEQKFKRGNLVEVLVGHQIWSNKEEVKDISPEDVGSSGFCQTNKLNKWKK